MKKILIPITTHTASPYTHLSIGPPCALPIKTTWKEHRHWVFNGDLSVEDPVLEIFEGAHSVPSLRGYINSPPLAVATSLTDCAKHPLNSWYPPDFTVSMRRCLASCSLRAKTTNWNGLKPYWPRKMYMWSRRPVVAIVTCVMILQSPCKIARINFSCSELHQRPTNTPSPLVDGVGDLRLTNFVHIRFRILLERKSIFSLHKVSSWMHQDAQSQWALEC